MFCFCKMFREKAQLPQR